MKFSFLFVPLVLSSLSQAATMPMPKPILIKNYDIGLVVPLQRINLSCLIYSDHITVFKSAGGVTSQSTTRVTFSGDLRALITKAATGKIVREEAPTDGPITEWNAANARGPVPLLSVGSQKYKNDSQEAQTLVNFINLHCPTAPGE